MQNLSLFIRQFFSSLPSSITSIIFISTVVYFNTVNNDFISDDVQLIKGNPWVTESGHVGEIFTSPVVAFDPAFQNVPHNYYRPMLLLTFKLQYLVFGDKPFGYHFINVLMNSGVSVAVFFIALLSVNAFRPQTASMVLYKSFSAKNEEFIGKPFIPILAALFFALHPIHSEVVNWIACQGELMYTLLCLWAFYLYAHSDDKGKINTKLVLSALLFFAALLYKETAAMFLLFIVVFDFTLNRIKAKPVKVLAMRYLPFALASIIYLALRINALGGIIPGSSGHDTAFLFNAINSITLFGTYLFKLVLPLGLHPFHYFEPVKSIGEGQFILSFLGLIIFVFLYYVVYRNDKPLSLCFAIILIFLIPVLYMPALAESVFIERALYLPSVGFVIMSAYLVVRLSKSCVPAILVLTVFVSCFYFAVTVKSISKWKNDFTFWSHIVSAEPKSFSAHSSLGAALYNKGRVDEAQKEYEQAISLFTGDPETWYNLAILYQEKGKLRKAVEAYERKSVV